MHCSLLCYIDSLLYRSCLNAYERILASVATTMHPVRWVYWDTCARLGNRFHCSDCSAQSHLGAGAIADITTRANRGTFFGAFNAGPMLAPGIGPVIGGLLSQYLGWRYGIIPCTY